MADSTTYISLIKPEFGEDALIREHFNDNMDTIDGRFSPTYMAVQNKNSVAITGGSIAGVSLSTITITSGTITGITDLVVADGGTGVSTLTDGGVLLGSGTGAITAMAVLTDGQMIVGNGTTDPVAESGSILRTSIGVAIGSDVQAYDAGLLSIAALTTATNKMIYTTASDTYATADLTAFARTILDDADEATFKATVNLEIGADVQAYDAALTSISGLTYVSDSFIKLTADDTYAVRTLSETKTDLDVDDLENLTNYLDSACVIAGGVVSNGTNAGTFKVTEITLALLRNSASATAHLTPVTLAEQDNQAIDDIDKDYFVIFTYGTPCTIDLSETAPNGWNIIPIGKVGKDGSNHVHYASGGYRLSDGVRKLHERAATLRYIELASGCTIAYSGTNNFTMATGVIYGGINRVSQSLYNSATTQFTPVYSDGSTGWTEGADRNTIDYEHYDNLSGTLQDIGVGRYGCHWVYKHIGDGHVYVVYGRDSYKLVAAELALEPTRPDHLTDFGCLIGCIIAPYGGGNFTTVQMVTDIFFVGTDVSNHAELGNLAYADAGHTGFATSGANSNITSMTGLTTPLGAAYGGTGVANNAASTITITGNYATTFTVTNTTGVTLPTTGELAITTRSIEDFGACTDVVTNNSSTSAHGLLLKLNNNSSNFLNGQGAWAAPAGAGEVNTASNVGLEVEVFKQKTDVDLEFRTLKANSNQITIALASETPDIDVGNAATDRGTIMGGVEKTIVDKDNPANASGTITSVEIWAYNTMSDCEVATFYVVSGDNLSTRDTEAIGTVTAGSKQTFAVNLTVETGDYIGIYYSDGDIETDNAGEAGIWYVTDTDYIPCTNETFGVAANYGISLYATGVTAGASGSSIEFDIAEENIKLDDLGTPDNNTDLDASTTEHGLLPILPNSNTQFLDGTGVWATLATGDIPDLSATYAVINQTMYIGTTGVAINRSSAALTLAGITLTTPDIGTPSAGTLTNCSFPTLNQNTTGTAANLSGTPALPNGTTATTQAGSDNSTKLATTAYADAAGAGGGATPALDNLASVAINTSLLSDTQDTDSLGSATKEWLNLYIGDAGRIYIGLGQDISLHRSAANTLFITASSLVSITGSLLVGGVIEIGDSSVDETELGIIDGATCTTTQLNYLNQSSGVTGTDSTNIVFSTSPTLVTPTLGAALATSISTPSIISAANADITIQPNGTGDTIIYAPADVVTAVTEAHTMTIAEAGTVTVSAAGAAYTITLPTASGHTGLRYHFVKTDYNYTLITLDGNGAETFNYENAAGAAQTTYPRLNTPLAEVTIVSDGTNWQVIDESMGQVPRTFAYLGSEQSNITGNSWIKVLLETEVYDIGSNFDTTNNKFVCPVAGKYSIVAGLIWKKTDFVVDKEYKMAIYNNNAGIYFHGASASVSMYLVENASYVGSFAATDYIELFAKYTVATDLQDIMEGASRTFMIIELISKD